jgi:hypothetical protein
MVTFPVAVSVGALNRDSGELILSDRIMCSWYLDRYLLTLYVYSTSCMYVS